MISHIMERLSIDAGELLEKNNFNFFSHNLFLSCAIKET